ncbi:3-phosphoshikimate 1-carboxyvinyltransferase [Lentiprolixibacter aurantiacus]|uniref:3-phosphoshikimate 1-carboxyvinyltransferase n=1 Tax=Lentiprolixibacter aurantiacus TaxID=2993939 RepID=A0AAE3SNF3_9FLAO|nr:3-phosphoshikimate 1-carboxyvinyltransferase [Lentiprolixibacter aurantiacus]MCX2719146.1 3-phosphoshikimate 1-carboxyvinyltransferase [Lentiprolixibacter aurantiacus]
MKLSISAPRGHQIKAAVTITGSKSESNRLLLLQALYPGITIENLSNADDVRVMQKGLQVKQGEVDIHHAGTAMRFLTAYFATLEGADIVLTGSSRMKERPIAILVDALRRLGADIDYLGNEGYPPLGLRGRALELNQISLPANVSSQYISALLLVAPSLKEGLILDLEGQITSVPYIRMTLQLLEELGIRNEFTGQRIRVYPKAKVDPKLVVVESDWSSASYFYSILALSEEGSELLLSSYKANSLQGDSVLQNIYADFGVETSFEGHSIRLTKVGKAQINHLDCDLTEAPDLAQTIAVSCFGLGISCTLTGLHTLKIKETDRLLALEKELTKLGGKITTTNSTLQLEPSDEIVSGVAIDTYNDHRMAMAFAPLGLHTPITINDAGVVSKSYPYFWKDLKTISFDIREVS